MGRPKSPPPEFAKPDIPWHKDLVGFKGGKRLGSVRVAHDFPWKDQFAQRQFDHGKALGKRVRADCDIEAQGTHEPVLLLTDDEKIPEHRFKHGAYYVVVVNAPAYKAFAETHSRGDPATTYFLGRTNSAVSRVARVSDVLEDAEALKALRRQLGGDTKKVRDFVEKLLARDAQEGDGEQPPTDPELVAAVIRAFASSDPKVVEALADVAGKLQDRDARERVLQAITADADGRESASTVLGARLADRVRDVKETAAKYNELVARESATETDLQQFIEKYPWILGLSYTSIVPRKTLTRGTCDFLLVRYDGSKDLVELKSPGDLIIEKVAKGKGGGAAPVDTPGPPNQYRLTRALANAIAQAHGYRHQLNAGDESTIWQDVTNAKNPWTFIIIGRTKGITGVRKRILDELRLSFHRVQILGYDEVGDHALQLMSNIGRLLLPPDEAMDESEADDDAAADWDDEDEGAAGDEG